jgi:peptidoglycan/LPS O-acetylase OafA/YrhL
LLVPEIELASLGYHIGLAHAYGYVWGYSLLNLGAALLIDCLVARRFAPWFFENPVLQHIGKVSYGFYVMHYPLQWLVAHFLHLPIVISAALQLGLTVLLATVSFRWWESRFLKLKDRWFPAGREAWGAGPSSAVLADNRALR